MKQSLASTVSLSALVVSSWLVCWSNSFTPPSQGRLVELSRQSKVLWPSHSTIRRLEQSKHQEFSANDDDNQGHYHYDMDVGDDDYHKADTQMNFRQPQPQRNQYGELMIVFDEASLSSSSSYDEEQRAKYNRESETRTFTKGPTLEYGFLRPGTVVEIEIGDLSLSRKAWKKRRRSASPLLVPCSILSVDRLSMVRWNLLFLLEKFGMTMKGSTSRDCLGSFSAIEISLQSMARYYQTYLKSSLKRQANALRFESSEEMVKALFSKNIQQSYGVFLEERTEPSPDNDDRNKTMLFLTAPITRHKGQARTANAPMVQFRVSRDGDHGGSDILAHTGYVRSLMEIDGEHRKYSYQPLSAALRVSHKEALESGHVTEGKVFTAAVFQFDKLGDGGTPRMTLTLDPGTVREKIKFRPDRRIQMIHRPKHMLGDLKMGDGPFKAKVVDMLKGKALVDLGVGAHVPGKTKTMQVLGTLHFRDAHEPIEKINDSKDDPSDPCGEIDDESDENTEDLISGIIDEMHSLEDEEEDCDDKDEEDDDLDVAHLLSFRKDAYLEEGEVEDDVSHLFDVDENGNLMYKDPVSGQLTLLEDGDEIFETDEGEDKETDDGGSDHFIASLDDAETERFDYKSLDFDDSIEDISDDEISNLIVENDDGTLTYRDPETNETMEVDKDDEEFQDMQIMKTLIDQYLSKSGETDDAHVTSKTSSTSKAKPHMKRTELIPGMYVQVYILDASKQSNRLRVTTNPCIKGQKPKDIKKGETVKKKLTRLKKIVGNEKNILRLKGREVCGIVKAVSKTGNWLYVEPLYDEALPVGVGLRNGDELDDITAGDYVQCHFDGIDYDRGQILLQIFRKLDENEIAETKKKQTQNKAGTIDVNSATQKHSNNKRDMPENQAVATGNLSGEG